MKKNNSHYRRPSDSEIARRVEKTNEALRQKALNNEYKEETWESWVRPEITHKVGGGISNLTMEEKVIMKRETNGKITTVEKLDKVRFQAGDNWGNRIYTNRATGNAIYKAFKNHQYGQDQGKLLSALISFLNENGLEYDICS